MIRSRLPIYIVENLYFIFPSSCVVSREMFMYLVLCYFSARFPSMS